ncbi:uncharacterized protein LOC128357541 [Scomber japonicus]|uniref:uncharacterized protein LOC128357541 n=1 Tax=Scomber japonicus TaxID=13676 RepID=UPI00230540E7|nr:uncharacterized protein LOC128357541 [Scomber japonicus]
MGKGLHGSPVFMMWGITLILVSSVAAQVTANEPEVHCGESHDFPPVSDTSPSFLADMKAEQVAGTHMINISWAINIDGSIQYLTGTRIVMDFSIYLCTYNPPLNETTSTSQKWFHYLVKASPGYYSIQVANLPLPPTNSGLSYIYKEVTIHSTTNRRTSPKPPEVKGRTSPKLTEVPRIMMIAETPTPEPKAPSSRTVAAIFGGLACLMILTSCIIFLCCNLSQRSYGTNLTTALRFKRLPTSPTVPVSVLMVYPAENLAFQRAVLALAEFLQWHGGCSVAIDMWQQGKIAELGPMRWLAEQAKAAEQVLIIAPQPCDSPPNSSSPGPSIPAAAHDLYPLILNMVASHAKSATELAQFWVVQMGEQQDKRLANLPLELGACKSFCLMKDLNKLCQSLYTQRQDDKKNTLDLFFRPGIAYSEKDTVKLRETVEKLSGHQPSISSEPQPLKSVISV